MNLPSRLLSTKQTALDIELVPAANAFVRGREGEMQVVSATELRYAGPEGKARLVKKDGHIVCWLLKERRLARMQWHGDHWKSQVQMLNLDQMNRFQHIVEGRMPI
jgi:hypothetical protein